MYEEEFGGGWGGCVTTNKSEVKWVTTYAAEGGGQRFVEQV